MAMDIIVPVIIALACLTAMALTVVIFVACSTWSMGEGDDAQADDHAGNGAHDPQCVGSYLVDRAYPKSSAVKLWQLDLRSDDLQRSQSSSQTGRSTRHEATYRYGGFIVVTGGKSWP